MRGAGGVVLVLGLGGCEPEPVSGRVVDAVSNEGLSVRLDVAGERCPESVESGLDGTFVLPGSCAGEIRSAAPERWIAPTRVAPGLELAALAIPAGDGVYLADGDSFFFLHTHTALEERRLWGSGASVWLPRELPDTLPRVSGRKELVLRGVSPSFEPLLPGPALQLDSAGAPQPVAEWYYVGSRIGADGPVAESASLDPDQVRAGPEGGPSLVFIGASALPPGRYVLRAGAKGRAFILDFGEAPAL